MRQRKIKNIDEKLKLFDAPLVCDPWNLRGKWREVFEDAASSMLRVPLYLEVGSGKGRFITESAASDPDALFIGFEGQESVLLRALQRAYVGTDTPTRELNEIAMSKLDAVCTTSPNLRFCSEYIMDMNDYFAENELDGIFLNFSDPWHKARQEKRRLTSPKYLDGYSHALASGGFIRFKTDNDKLFSYSVEQFEAHEDFDVIAQTDDLHASEFSESSIRTEYELRFINLNKKIHYLEARCRG